MIDFRGCIISTVTTTRGQIIMYVNVMSHSLFASIYVVNVTNHKNFGTYLESFVKISLTSTSMRAAISNDELAKCWGIHPYCVKAMVQCTTQRGVHKVADPSF